MTSQAPDPEASSTPERFEELYTHSPPPWEIGRPQSAFVRAAEGICGEVLDCGCGTGENALFLAGRGCRVTGIDFLEHPIVRAREKAARTGLAVDFRIHSALELDGLDSRFDHALDCGLFHSFSDADRRRYLQGLSGRLRPGGGFFLLCFSDREPPGLGPRRITESELRRDFSDGWQIESLEATRFEVREDATKFQYSDGGPHAWFATIQRLGG